MSLRVRVALLAVILVSAFGGCAEDDPTEVEPTIQNAPPETSVDSKPPDLDAASFTIDFAWSGTDEDGEVAYFEWVMTDDGIAISAWSRDSRRSTTSSTSSGRSPQNWLEIYQKCVRNVMLAGPRVMTGFLENLNLISPIVFNLGASPPAGLGTVESFGGTVENVGT